MIHTDNPNDDELLKIAPRMGYYQKGKSVKDCAN